MTQAGANIVEIQVRSRDMSGPGFDAATKRARGFASAVDGGPGSAGQAIVGAEKKAAALTGTLSRVGAVAGGILAADILREAAQRVTQLAQQTVHAASSLGESLNAVDKTFGTSADTIHKWAESNANAFGLSQRAFNEAATPLGAMLKNQGLSMQEVESHTISLTKRAADMASVFNVNVSDALVAIQAGLRGESDPLERFGVSLQAVAVDSRALADTGKTTTAQLTQQERAVARLELIYDQTAQTQNDFADTSTGLANAQRIATARIEDAQAKIGATFLPVMAAAANVSGNFAKAVGDVPGPVAAAAAAIALLAAGTLVFAPRVIASKEALDKMSESSSAVVRNTGKMAVAVGKAGAAFAVLQIGGAILSQALAKDLNPQLDAITANLKEWDGRAKLSGEAARVFGADAEKLDHGLQSLTVGGLNKTLNKVSEVGAGLLQLGDLIDDGVEEVKAYDTALAQMVRAGNGDQAFTLIAEAANRTGISINDIIKALPEYAAAAEVAAHATKTEGNEMETTREKLDRLTKATHDGISASFGYEDAADAAADSLAQLAEKVKENTENGIEGAKSLTGNTQAARDNREAVRGITSEYETLIQQAYAAGKSTDGLAKDMENQLVAMGFSREEAARYTAQIQGLGAALNSLPAVTSPEVILRLTTQETNRETNRIGLMGAREHGGIVGAAGGGPRSGRTLVGEHGIEILDLAPGTNVHSNEDSMRMMAAAASGGGSGYGAGGGGGGGGGSLGFVEIGSDGTKMGDWIIELLAGVIRGRGGDPSLIGLKIRT